MYFKCLVVARMTPEQVCSGQSILYRPAILPDGCLGHENSPNCSLFVIEQALPYALALNRAGAVHQSHIFYQHQMLEAQGYSPMWVPII